MHIEAFKGKDSENNKVILEALALNGSLIKWDIYKAVKKERRITWSTVSRRVDDLKERGYVMETGKRKIRVGRREEDSPLYGLTWRGLIASLTSDQLHNNVFNVLEKNPQIDRSIDQLLPVAREIFTVDEIREMTQKLFEAIRLVPLELESANEEEIICYTIPALDKVGFRIPEKDLSKLGQRPESLKFLYKTLEALEECWEALLEETRSRKHEIEKLLTEIPS